MAKAKEPTSTADIDIMKVTIDILNEAYVLDPAAVHALICNRVPCNVNLAEHGTVVVDENKVATGDSFAVGALGLINGIISKLCPGRSVAVMFYEPGENGRSKIAGFMEFKHSSI